jgi:exodeoxyribonuclease V beta subunit
VAIEASAGTGKTFTLAALATRYLAEQDLTPSDLLIVTFTRAATAELRSRIRGQLIGAVSALSGGTDGQSELVQHLVSADRDVRRQRLERAVADFDAASISTIHGFATQIRRTLGLAAVDPDARLTDSTGELVAAACADALAAASVLPAPAGGFPSMAVLVEATARKLGGADLVLVPDGSDADVDRTHVVVRDLVVDAVARIEARRRAEASIGFDDVLVQLRDSLSNGDSAAVAALRSRYKVVLIDEFQDTDRIQWEIFSTLFGRSGDGTTLVLVGDPKQAIYRFRGADIAVYLDVLQDGSVTARHSLTTNWRADGTCVDGLHALVEGVTFGDPSIGYVTVRPADVNRDRYLRTADGTSLSGMHLRLAPRAGLPEKEGGGVDSERVNRMVERDVAAHVRDLLERARIPARGDGSAPRDLEPSDVAVLVTTWGHAHDLQRAFAREGIPAVVAGTGSVLESEAAQHVRFLLEAMERPGDLRRVRTYALSWFEGWSVDEVAVADDADLAGLQDRLADWATRLADRPVVEVLAHLWQQTGVIARTLGLADGDRNVTDLDHVAEVLHGSAPQGRSGVAGLLSILDGPPEGEADAESDGDVTARRIESEARTVLITTVWRAKGLEFPVVCIPMLWRRYRSRTALVFTDPDTGERKLDVTLNGKWPDESALKDRKALASREEAAERLRILYVALTRAQHHTAVWWAGSAASTNALTRLLFARDGDGAVRPGVLDPDGTKVPTLKVPADPVAALSPLAATSGGALTVSTVSDRPAPVTPWASGQPGPSGVGLDVAPFGRTLDRSVARWSFTAITRRAVEDQLDPFDTSGADGGAADETGSEESLGSPPPGPVRGPDDTGVVAPLGSLVAGTTFGTFVHAILETVDFASPSLTADLEVAASAQADRAGLDLGRLAWDGGDGSRLLVDGLQRVIHTPMGPLFDGTPLASVERSDRIDELGFDLRLGAGTERPSVRDIGRLVVEHLDPGHPLADWADALAHGSIDTDLVGYLTGSIDLVARRHGPDGDERFVVADYKTNRLGRRGEPQRVGDYGPERLGEAMAEHHYPLQALLYAAALHRYLRWKRPDGGAPTLVAGAAYLFVRGMTGPDVATSAAGGPNGVFTWELPPALVTGLSDLLDGRRPVGAGR